MRDSLRNCPEALRLEALDFHGLVAATVQVQGDHVFVGGRLGGLPGAITGVAAPVLAVAVLMIAYGSRAPD